MPESPRFKAQVQGETRQANEDIATYSDGVVDGPMPVRQGGQRMGSSHFLRDRRMLMLLIGTAGSVVPL